MIVAPAQPVLTEPVTRTFGPVTLTAQSTIDGGYTLIAQVGGKHFDALGYSTWDWNDLQHRIADIADRALAGMLPEDIADEINARTLAEMADGITAAHNERVAAARPTAAQVRSISDLRQLYDNGHRELNAVRRSATFREPTPTELKMLADAAANDGFVAVGGGHAEGTMRRAASHGFGTLAYGAKRKFQVTGFRASKRGLRAVEVTR